MHPIFYKWAFCWGCGFLYMNIQCIYKKNCVRILVQSCIFAHFLDRCRGLEPLKNTRFCVYWFFAVYIHRLIAIMHKNGWSCILRGSGAGVPFLSIMVSKCQKIGSRTPATVENPTAPAVFFLCFSCPLWGRLPLGQPPPPLGVLEGVAAPAGGWVR